MSPVVATVGVFDGVHRGHAALVHRARRRAEGAGARAVVLTFEPHPDRVFQPDTAPLRLTSAGETVRRLRAAGADEVRVLRFTRELADKAPERFLRDHLFCFGPLAGLVVGYDFAMGRSRRGTPAMLAAWGQALGFFVETVPAVIQDGRPISSTRVREALARGEVREAAGLLGRAFTVEGVVERGEGRGRTLGFPTANLRLREDRARPADGVYAVWVSGAGPEPLPGVVNIGLRPTFSGKTRTVEAHVLAPVRDLVGSRLTLEFADRLRDEAKFNSVNELQEQIHKDCRAARALLEAASSAS